jgi:SAM-dependent methyltransferase
VAEGAIDAARKSALDTGVSEAINYQISDLNSLELPPCTYDAVFVIQAAHHIYNLERFFKQIKQSLKPNSLLFIDEYVGPSYLQCSPLVVDIINRIRQILPDQYLRSAFLNGAIAPAYINSPIEHFELTDPSEAIRSAEIKNVLNYYFDIVDVKNYGGAILHMLLSGISGNFNENNPSDVALLRLMALLEELLEESGVIQSDHAAMVAKPR